MTQPGLRHIHTSRSLLGVLHRVSDALAIVLGLVAGDLISWYGGTYRDAFAVAATSVALFLLVAELTGLYRSWRGVPVERELGCAVLTWLYVAPLVLAAKYLSGAWPDLPRSTWLAWFLVTPALMSCARLAVRAAQRELRARGLNTRGFAIVGVTELGLQLARNIEQSPEMGLQLVGFYDDRSGDRTPDLPQDIGRRLGDLADLLRQARLGQVSVIFITFPMRAEDRIRHVLAQLADTTASVYIVPDFFVFELLHARWTQIGGLPAVSVFENPLYGINSVVKRAMDLVLSGLGLIVLGFPMLAIAAAIRLTSPGPALFRQRRYGLDGREILVWKFRTMRVCEDGPQIVQASKNDDRVTPLGGFLRRTSLDELPQLLNVLAGSMSLVGPRPHATAHNEQYRQVIQGYMLRHKVKPGITGLAQVNGWRGQTDTLDKMQRRIEFDHRYIREWSLWLDVKILIQTVWVVLRGTNAH
jgi:putative colanic acid biosynthesis UDP-glucose lipid carrier transferase